MELIASKKINAANSFNALTNNYAHHHCYSLEQSPHWYLFCRFIHELSFTVTYSLSQTCS